MDQDVIISSVVFDKQSAAPVLRGPSRGFWIRTCGEVTTARGHSDHKHWECVNFPLGKVTLCWSKNSPKTSRLQTSEALLALTQAKVTRVGNGEKPHNNSMKKISPPTNTGASSFPSNELWQQELSFRFGIWQSVHSYSWWKLSVLRASSYKKVHLYIWTWSFSSPLPRNNSVINLSFV